MKQIAIMATTILLTSAIWSCRTTKETTKYDSLSISSIATAKWLQRTYITLRDTIRITISDTNSTVRPSDRQLTIVRHLQANTRTQSKDTIVKSEVQIKTQRESKRPSAAIPISTSHKIRDVFLAIFVVVLGYVLVRGRRR